MYNVNYFINKFQAIPESKWTTKSFRNAQGAKCAMGHCLDEKIYPTAESDALETLFFRYLRRSPECVNDGASIVYQQKTPKERILAALRDIKDKMRS